MGKRRFSSPPPTNKPKEQAKPDDKPGKAYWSKTPNGPVKIYTREEIAAYERSRSAGRSRVNQTQIEKAIKAAQRTGLQVKLIELRQNGSVALSSELNPLDEDQLDAELAKWRESKEKGAS